MIPSFFPLFERGLAARGAPLPLSLKIDPETGTDVWTLDELIAMSKKFRFIDGVHIDYDRIVGKESDPTTPYYSPFTVDGRAIAWPEREEVVIVGAGMSGLLTALQLVKAGISVTVIEANPDPGTIDGHAGRVWPVNVVTDDTTNAQLGCMRFPTLSYLFWHYIERAGAYPADKLFYTFPNVGAVPSTFRASMSGADVVSGVWKGGQSPWALPLLPDELDRLETRHINLFMNYTPAARGGKSTTLNIDTAANLLLDSTKLTQDAIDRLKTFWDLAMAELYGVSYKEFLQRANPRFTEEEIDQIGYMGVGTGGFEPLFNVDCMDIMRLFLWRYSAEMDVPLLRKLAPNLRARVNEASARAPGAGRVRWVNSAAAIKVVYNKNRGLYGVTVRQNDRLTRYAASQVVLAMTHDAVKRVLDPTVATPETTLDGDIVPFTEPSLSSLRSNIWPQINGQQSMNSVKAFISIPGPAAQAHWPYLDLAWASVQDVRSDKIPYDHRIRAQYGTLKIDPATGKPTRLGVTYTLATAPPTPFIGKPKRVLFANQKTAIGLHYSWGAHADRIYADIVSADAAVGNALAATGQFAGRDRPALQQKLFAMEKTRFEGASSWRLDRLPGTLASFFDPVKTGINNIPGALADNQKWGYLNLVYWKNVPYVYGGFKLDAPGIGSYLTFAYRTLALAGVVDGFAWDVDETNSRGGRERGVHFAVKNLFFAGDSFSNYGGWVEGAFQSALATSAALIWNRALSGPRFPGDSAWPQSLGLGVLNVTTMDALITNARDPVSSLYTPTPQPPVA